MICAMHTAAVFTAVFAAELINLIANSSRRSSNKVNIYPRDYIIPAMQVLHTVSCIHIIAHVGCFTFRSCTSPLGTSRRGTLYK